MGTFLLRWKWAVGTAALLVAGLTISLWPKPLMVDAARVSRGEMIVSVSDDGVTRAEEYYVVSAPVTGYVSRVETDVGDPVHKNDYIAFMAGAPSVPLDRRTVEELRATLQAAQANERAVQASLAQSQRDLTRAKALDALGFVSKAQLEQSLSRVAMLEAMVAQGREESHRIRAALTQPTEANSHQSIPIRAPVSGTVLAVITESEGSVVQGTPIVTVGDPMKIEAVVDLISREAAQVRLGAPVRVTQWGGTQPIKGHVTLVEPVGHLKVSALGIEEQRVNVIISFDASQTTKLKKLGHGYQIEAQIILWQRPDILRVPIGALFRSAAGSWQVFRIQNGRAHLRNIQLGHLNDEYGEVLAGLKNNDLVVLNPNRSLKDAMPVKARR